MREINRMLKFRAWDKEARELKYVSKIDWIQEQAWYTSPVKDSGQWNLLENIELMQYTGFKDKNGKKIWESDLMEFPTGYIVEIVFEEGQFRWKGHDAHSMYAEHGWWENAEKIGNIYESPELLTNK